MKTKFKLLAVMIMALGLFACSNDDESSNIPPKPGILGHAETYATISIAMPDGGETTSKPLSKTDPENGDYFEKGTEEENTFNSVALYFFDGHTSTSTCTGVLTMAKELFTKNTIEGENIIYTSTAQKIGIEGTDIPVYAVVNGSISGVNTGTKLTDFLALTVKTDQAINTQWLLMTSRTPGSLTISAIKNNVSTNPAHLSVSVDRTAAKITYKAEKNTPGQENQYDVQKEGEGASEVAATVTLTDYKLVNLRNDAYYFRKVAGEEGDWLGAADLGNGLQTSNNYVIDPYFTRKTVEAANAENFVTEWFGADKAYADNTNKYVTLPTNAAHQLLGYCMENTTRQNAQLNGYSTGIIFKATYVPKKVYVLKQDRSEFEAIDYPQGTTFYRYANVLYKTKSEIIEHYKLEENTTLIDEYTGDNSKGATCYYKYWIRHMDNKLPEQMNIMEFAIVRNNAYKLSVNKVSSIGDPSDVIDPENPDETSKMYLDVEVTILPWVVRSNEGIIL